MIFVSSSCIKAKKISEAVRVLAEAGFLNIELSGGTQYYSGFEKDLIQLRDEFGLTYLIHNYFPPPKEHFVLNLASSDNAILSNTMQHCKRAIDLAETLGINKYGVHAGFLMDPQVNELGKGISHYNLVNRDEAIMIFCEAYKELKEYSKTVKVYVENNVVSQRNFLNFGANPFLLTDYESYMELQQYIDFNLLLDLAHLKVSCNTLGLDFKNQALRMASISDYLHLSDNDGKEDSNRLLDDDSEILTILERINCTEKTITLEIYEELDSINESMDRLKKIIS